jgi:hypothetical protein
VRRHQVRNLSSKATPPTEAPNNYPYGEEEALSGWENHFPMVGILSAPSVTSTRVYLDSKVVLDTWKKVKGA